MPREGPQASLRRGRRAAVHLRRCLPGRRYCGLWTKTSPRDPPNFPGPGLPTEPGRAAEGKFPFLYSSVGCMLPGGRMELNGITICGLWFSTSKAISFH